MGVGAVVGPVTRHGDPGSVTREGRGRIIDQKVAIHIQHSPFLGQHAGRVIQSQVVIGDARGAVDTRVDRRGRALLIDHRALARCHRRAEFRRVVRDGAHQHQRAIIRPRVDVKGEGPVIVIGGAEGRGRTTANAKGVGCGVPNGVGVILKGGRGASRDGQVLSDDEVGIRVVLEGHPRSIGHYQILKVHVHGAILIHVHHLGARAIEGDRRLGIRNKVGPIGLGPVAPHFNG